VSRNFNLPSDKFALKIQVNAEVKGKVITGLLINKAPRHKDVWGEKV
jgi:hypothetical protein